MKTKTTHTQGILVKWLGEYPRPCGCVFTVGEDEYKNVHTTQESCKLHFAAPDLLKALQVLLETVSDDEKEEHDLGQGHDVDSCALCMARAAIAKAEGR